MKAENFGNHPYEGEYIKEEEEFTEEEEYDDEIENENNGSIKRRKEYDTTYKKKRKTQGSDNVTPNIELNYAFDDVHIQHHQMETPSGNTPNRNSKRLSILSKSTPATIATPRQTNTTPKYHNSNRTTRSDLLSPRIDNITNSLEQSYNNSIIQSPQRIPSTSSQNVIEQEEVVTPPTTTSGTFTSKLLLISLLFLPALSIFLYFDQQERIHEISYSIKRKAQLFYDFSTSTLKQTYIIDKMMDLLNEKADRSEVERMMKSGNSGTCSNNYNFEFGKFVSKDELHETIGHALHELEYKITTRLNTRASELSKENKVDLEMGKADIKKEISKIKLEIQQMVEEQINKKVSSIPQSPSQLVNSIKKQDIESTIESTVNNMRTDIKKEILPVVKKMIDQAIEVYASDRINMTDFALISMGSRIVEHSPTFTSNGWGNWLVSTKQPGIMLQTDVTIGNCWPMKGKSGYVVIQIAFPITPTHFSIDHIPASLSPDISSAPKLFSIYGYDNHTSLVKLTDYEYDINGPAVQTFPVSETIVSKFQLFRLQIKDNYGNENYTCIYRFRIHGKHD
ncbi:hypothetical protein ABK040_006027 [Willaertia magna]